MSEQFSIQGRWVGVDQPVYIVAEMSGNHLGRFDDAVRILEAAKLAGADAIKLQTYTPETMTLDCESDAFRVSTGTIWNGRKLHDLYAEASTPWKWHAELMQRALSLGLDLFSTPFDASAVDFLETLNVPAYKIASFELVDLPLISRVAQTGKPLILSTGMSTLAELEEAVSTARQAGAGPIALLKCTSAYPADPAEMNLRTIADLASRFGVVSGLSDHTLGVTVPVAAVSLGACIIEKHLTLSREAGGPDAAFSLEPSEFAEMVSAVRTAQASLGAVQYEPSASESACRVLRRSLFVVNDMSVGEVFTKANLRCIRPGHGLAPKCLPEVLGRRARVNIQRGSPLAWDLVERGDG